MRVAAAVGIALAVQGSFASAKEPPAPSPLVAALLRCKAMPEEGARVRCYDAAVADLADATSKGDVMVVDREDVRKTRRSLFGFAVPRIPLFKGDTTEEDQPDEIEAKIQSVRDLGYDKWLIVLDTGARWQTTEPASSLTPRPGDSIRIKKALMGSYFISIGGARAVKGMRVG